MKGERLTEELARGLAAPTRRRTVLAGLGAGLAVALGAVAGSREADAGTPRHLRRKRCRRREGCCGNRIDCGFGEACVDRRCTPLTAFAKRGRNCRTTADCSTAQGPAVCAFGYRWDTGCAAVAGNSCERIQDWICFGDFDPATGEAATCWREEECAAGLSCQDGFCRPAAAS